MNEIEDESSAPESEPVPPSRSEQFVLALRSIETLVEEQWREIEQLHREIESARLQTRLGSALAPRNSSRERLVKTVSAAARRARGRPEPKALEPEPGVEPRVARAERGEFAGLEELFLSAQNLADQMYRVAASSAEKPLPTYVPRDGKSLAGEETAVKALAFYLPQFHPFPENDDWWGKGFTEWTNVSKAAPQFPGHYQPHLPDALGFYDLRLQEIIHEQVEMALQYGVYGFCFYYYSFGGKRLLERPIKSFVDDPTLSMPFCLMWANENWTRRWDGRADDILIGQNHTPETDVAFIEEIEPYLENPRYIRIGDRPLLLVYRPDLFPSIEETAKRWREYRKSRGLADLFLVASQAFEIMTDPRTYGFDAAVQFPPHGVFRDKFAIHSPHKWRLPIVHDHSKITVYSYEKIVAEKLAEEGAYDFPTFEGVFPIWDNSARKPEGGYCFAESTPELFGQWLEHICGRALQMHEPDRRFVFINAWNEWAEGAHLEPDRRFGFAYLAAQRSVMEKYGR